MRTMFALGHQSTGRSFFLGQGMQPADRNHYLTAIDRALVEADEIDAWLAANPTMRLNPPPVTTPPSELSVSPYYTKYANFTAAHPALTALRDRLMNPNPTTWASLTGDEHLTFGWVNVVDQVYSAFKADPLNLTVGRWQGGTRLPDLTSPGVAAPDGSVTIPILNVKLPPTLAGVPTQTVLIAGGGLLGVGILYMILRP